MREAMPRPSFDADVGELAPSAPTITPYDEAHMITYVRVLDAAKEGADWRDVARIALRMNPELDADRAQRAFESHLARAKWMTSQGYRLLLRQGGWSHEAWPHVRSWTSFGRTYGAGLARPPASKPDGFAASTAGVK
jgi:hypothetical protein